MDFLMRKMTGIAGPVKNGAPGGALIESIADTGTTISSPSVGPEAPVYQLGLQVTPIGGAGAPYQVTIKAVIPRLYIPMVLPGARLGVMVDPLNPMNASPDFSRIGGAAPAAPVAPGGFNMDFDASGRSADQLLATGTHGTAVITTAMPLGKTVRDLNPAADPSRLNDPVWVFTVEVTVAGEAPFPAVFGHRVPLAKLASVALGVKLAIAVNMANRNQEVAIDWDKSPIA